MVSTSCAGLSLDHARCLITGLVGTAILSPPLHSWMLFSSLTADPKYWLPSAASNVGNASKYHVSLDHLRRATLTCCSSKWIGTRCHLRPEEDCTSLGVASPLTPNRTEVRVSSPALSVASHFWLRLMLVKQNRPYKHTRQPHPTAWTGCHCLTALRPPPPVEHALGFMCLPVTPSCSALPASPVAIYPNTEQVSSPPTLPAEYGPGFRIEIWQPTSSGTQTPHTFTACEYKIPDEIYSTMPLVDVSFLSIHEMVITQIPTRDAPSEDQMLPRATP